MLVYTIKELCRTCYTCVREDLKLVVEQAGLLDCTIAQLHDEHIRKYQKFTEK
jgi:hypothetical protein